MKNDEISLQTKTRLAQALKSCMARKSFDKITVKELLEACDLSRPTFYYHFQDIDALMEWMFNNEMVSLLRKSEDCLTWDDGILLLLRYAQDNRAVCLCAYESVGYDALRRMFFQSVASILKVFIDNLNADIGAKPEHVDFITGFYTQAFASSLLSWIQDGMKQTPEEMIKLLDITMHGNIAGALRRSATEK